MKDKLVIVESPTKARTITRFLGGDARILASMGHIRDLPENSLGVDVQHHFHPAYVLTRNGRRVIEELKKAAGAARQIYLATDPDREGEAIAWHIAEVLHTLTKASFHRISFHEITRDAILHAFSEPGEIDRHKVDAQQARRVLDRIVGYQVSPMLWKKIRKGTSAGRVQSVALRLICERERAILSFAPVEYWNLDALFQPVNLPDTFPARLAQLDGKKPDIPNAEMANALAAELEKASFRVVAVAKTPKTQRPPPPFITSTLQQAAGNALRMGAGQTMRVAQDLYEGVEIGSEGPVGLITYMRTDAVDVAKEAQEAARHFIASTFGAEFVPEKPNIYRSRQTAQAAHEAIRPTDVRHTPESLERHLSAPQARLYRLIWNRFVASQMVPARMLEHTIDVGAEAAGLTHSYIFRASATLPVFPGYLKVYDLRESEFADKEKDSDEVATVAKLPDVEPGTGCLLKDLNRKQGFTEPPKRYSEATLVRELEQNGIGRPSTYASIVETIQDREYVTKDKGRLLPTPLGHEVNDYLVATLPDLFQVGFTAEMETQLDRIEEGNVDWTAMLEDFYARFQKWSGGAGTVSAPTNARTLAFLLCFPQDLPWKAPTRRGTRTYDDRKFFQSLYQQAEGRKPVSDKQWQAILALAARYADHIPDLLKTAVELGVDTKLKAMIEREKNPEPTVVAESAKNLATDLQPLLNVLQAVTWDDPVKRGGRTFNDKRFYSSLADQVAQGKGLSEPQAAALRRLSVKYREQIPGFAELARQCSLVLPEDKPEAGRETGDAARAAGLLALLDPIATWDAPKKRGARTYDDHKFVNSIREQFEKRKSLSPKQVDALSSLVRRYAKQIPGYDAKALELGLGPKPKPELLSANCPKCGAPLVRRQSRGRAFFGCSAFPKCRFLANTLPETPAGAA